MSRELVNVYSNFNDGTGYEILTRVHYNDNLDFFDGQNTTCGCTGMHAGLTKLRDGTYVLIHGSQWQGDLDWAEIIDEYDALDLIVKTDNLYLLDEPRFKDLKQMYEKQKANKKNNKDEEDEEDEEDDYDDMLCPHTHLNSNGWYEFYY